MRIHINENNLDTNLLWLVSLFGMCCHALDVNYQLLLIPTVLFDKVTTLK